MIKFIRSSGDEKEKETADTPLSEEIAKALQELMGNERTAAIACVVGLIQEGVSSLAQEEQAHAWAAGLKSLTLIGIRPAEISKYLVMMEKLGNLLIQGGVREVQLVPTTPPPEKKKRSFGWGGYL